MSEESGLLHLNAMFEHNTRIEDINAKSLKCLIILLCKGGKLTQIMAILIGLLIASGALASPDSRCTIHFDDLGKNSRTVQVQEGKLFTVCLAHNPSTGYTWTLPFEKSMGLERLMLLDILYEPGAKQSKGLTGVPGMSVYRFAAVKPGMVILALENHRLWELQAEVKPVLINLMILPSR